MNDNNRRKSGRVMSRREFTLLAGGAIGGSALLGACGGDSDDGSSAATTAGAAATTTTASPTTAPAAAETKTLRFGFSGGVTSADTLDPAFRTSASDGLFQALGYEQLVEHDESLAARPLLAESWQSNDSGTEWTFNLREGVTFHDGKPLIADDVVYTYQRLIDPDVGSPAAGNLPGLEPDGIVAIDDRTVRFTLTAANVDFPQTTIFTQSMIVPDGATSADLATRTNGTGAFRTDSFTPGELTTVFESFPDYWQSGKPAIDALEVIAIAEPEAQVAALLGGQVDVISNAQATSLDELDSDPNTILVINPVGGMTCVCAQIDVAPYDNNDLRLAIKYAGNRQQMIDLVNQGRGHGVNDIPIPSLVEFGIEGTRQRDLAMAQEHLSRAGFADGIDLTLTLAPMQDWTEWTTVWQQQLAEAKINVEFDTTPADTYWGDQWLQRPLFMTGWNVRNVDAGLGLWYSSSAEWNETHWFRDDWDALLATARATIDPTQRRGIYQQLQQMIVEEGGHFVTHMYGLNGATRSNVSGWQPSAGSNIFRDISIS